MKKLVLFMLLAMMVSINSYAANGDEFVSKTIEGAEILFRVINSDEKLVQVGSEYHPDQTLSRSYQGGVTIPSSVSYNNEEYIVNKIAEKAFMYCSGLTSIEIPNGVKSIGGHAFYQCNNLESLKFLGSIETIEGQAFQGCSSLKTVSFSEGLVNIGNLAFADCTSLNSLNLPNSVSTIGPGAFGNCSKLSVVEIPENINTIGENAFRGCNDITNVVYNCKEIGAWFGEQKSNNSFSPYDYVKNINKVVIGPNVKSIGDWAFYWFTGLTSIQIPNGVISIGKYAFSSCTGLSSIEIPNSVTNIEDRAFWGARLKSITIPGSLSYIGSSVFDSNLESITIEEGATYIGGLNDCKKLTTIAIPNTVTTVGDFAFCGCIGLTSVSLSNNLEDIGPNAFQGCAGLTSVHIPDNVATIGERAFSGCTGLTTIALPKNLLKIGDKAFENCTGLTSIEINCDDFTTGKNVFDYCNNIENLVFNSIKTTRISGIEKQIKKIVISDQTEGITDNSFGGHENLISCVIGKNVKSIGINAFAGCTGLTSIEMPNNITRIGYGAFYGCTGLTSVEIPGSMASIDDGFHNANWNNIFGAFEGCTGLTSVTIHEGVKYIGANAFVRCTGLTSLEIPKSVETIAEGAFSNCTGLTSVIIGNGVNKLGNYAFGGCSGLSLVKIPGSVSSLSNAFVNCSNLKSLIFEDGTDSLTIESYLSDPYRNTYAPIFNNSPLEYIYLGRNIKFVRTSSVKEMPTTTKLEIGGNIVGINYNTILPFSGFISNVLIKNTVTNISNDSFNNCSYLKTIVIEDGESTLNFGGIAFYGSHIDSVYIGRNFSFPENNPPFKRNREGLKKLVFGPHVTVIPESAFSGHKGLTTLLFSEGLKKIGTWAFYGCTGIESLTIPSSVEEIEVGALGLWDGLKKLKIDDSDKELLFYKDPQYLGSGPDAFLNSELLEEVYVGRNISFDTERTSPFFALVSLSKLSLGKQITNIPSRTFGACKQLVDVYCYPEQVPTTGIYIFTESYLPNASLHIPVSAYKEYGRTSPWSLFGRLFAIMEDGQEKEAFKVSYMLDNKEYTNDVEFQGNVLTPPEITIPEGYSFTGWIDLPETMPGQNLVVSGSLIVNKYKITYMVDGAEYINDEIEYGTTITPEPAPTKEGYTFSGWSEIPSTMPSHDVTVTGSFTINKYKVTYIVDGKEYKSTEMEFGLVITPEPAPTKEGYTFSGWSEIPNTVPAHDVTITGSFTINKYKVTYMVDGVEYKTIEVEYGTALTPIDEPTKIGYTFTGWVGLPETMPSNDVTVVGSFSINSYTLTYIVDGVEYKTAIVEYGATITPESNPTKEGYTFSGWSEIPRTMPSHDVTITGSFTINKYNLTYVVDGVEYKTIEVEYGTTLTPIDEPTKTGYTFTGWVGLPETMPSNDVTVVGSFSINSYTLTYIVDGVEYKTAIVEYGATITPESNPTKEGYTFSGWSEIPETMPAHDVTITGSFTKGAYILTYIVDGVVYKTVSYDFDDTITPESAPTKEGYTFSGWSEIPETMPANNVTVTGTFTINTYKIVYFVDGVEYGSSEIEYGAEVNPIGEPSKEGYTFSGWMHLPEAMPAHDVTVTGTFSVNSYKVTFVYGDSVLTTIEVKYGAAIELPTSLNSERYTLVEWKDVPDTMPAHDITIYADYVDGINTITADRKDEQYIRLNGMYAPDLNPGLNIIRMKDGTTKKVWVK